MTVSYHAFFWSSDKKNSDPDLFAKQSAIEVSVHKSRDNSTHGSYIISRDNPTHGTYIIR